MKMKKAEITANVVEELQEEAPVLPKTGDWKPKTDLGKKVFSGEVTDINEVLDKGQVILEQEIVDILVPNLENDLLLVGQAKGKFGGGKQRVFRQTQKKTKEGNKPKFAALAVVGNRNGIIGIGYGKSKETVPAREKAVRNAKVSIFKIRRGSGSWESRTLKPHSIPFAVEGKCGSVIVKLIPAPIGTGLKADHEIAKILAFAGIKDCWTQTFGQTRQKLNLLKATERALRKLMTTKLQQIHYERLSVEEKAFVTVPKEESE
ncbi:MAG: 30S ribosomal protein S5 [Candidatus Woesearchaeota archaeon]|nr:30S ribosomal protein S5 [Candidatus Woesearchaeota archaeon]